MMIGKKASGTTQSIPNGLLTGSLVSTITTLLLTAVLVVLLHREVILWEAVGYGILIMVMLSSYLGARTAYKRIRRQKLLISIMSGTVYFGILLLINALFFGGQFQAVGVTALLAAGGCLCAALTGRGQGRRVQPVGERKRTW